ncbi:hypothetical protein BU24DRAFT_146368 [Aaosphaeria arxii CBS 175.79]|uniref:Uncharacterized protein n=1 Tax=Aaosphaeria arxii CBS 175.79 TaxID=1450172 RepID=A0A6A5XWK3_9PLEO|nr:uncharacterized protein BU24DRAFT_146368 [Aaosphaeria arxii CBS 175.79]KAF2017227.1 hypothetical protein BU24DRAFT_146368 [Aaosphaeria arxii CBS 175.79]
MDSQQLNDAKLQPDPLFSHPPTSIRAGAHDESQFAPQTETNPLEVRSASSVQATPDYLNRGDPFKQHTQHGDEPPPPYELQDPSNAPASADPIEYALRNHPYPAVAGQQRLPLSRGQSMASQSSNSTIANSLVPSPLHVIPARAPSSSRAPEPAQAFSSAKAREAGFEIEPDHRTPQMSSSMSSSTISASSLPRITILSSTEALQHTREPGKLTAYLIPFPKPRLKDVQPGGVPDRFLVFTPLPPPLAKPAPGEKENGWRKTRRQWQEDTRKGLMRNASLATWAGMKAKSSKLLTKSVDLTRSSNVEFLDRVAADSIASVNVDETSASASSRGIPEPTQGAVELPSPVPTAAPHGVAELESPLHPSMHAGIAELESPSNDAIPAGVAELPTPIGPQEKIASQNALPPSSIISPMRTGTTARAPPPPAVISPMSTGSSYRSTTSDSSTQIGSPAPSRSSSIPMPAGGAVELDAPVPSAAQIGRIELDTTPSSTATTRTDSINSQEKEKEREKILDQLTLIYPPSIALPPTEIRKEFLDSLTRLGDRSRKDAYKASAILPIAATLDASLIVTLGSLSEVSGMWAYNSFLGAKVSRKLVRGIEIGGRDPSTPDLSAAQVSKTPLWKKTLTKAQGKEKEREKTDEERSIELCMQESAQVEILRRYLELACLEADFHMFPQIEAAAGDVSEGTVLEAIGWRPTRRQGRDLEYEMKEKVTTTLTPEQDEQWQRKEAKADVKKLFKKGAVEWAAWCKAFNKDPEGALRK